MKTTSLAAILLAGALTACAAPGSQTVASAQPTTLDGCFALPWDQQQPCIDRVMFTPKATDGMCLKAENYNTPTCQQARAFIMANEAKRLDPADAAVKAYAFCAGVHKDAWSRSRCVERQTR